MKLRQLEFADIKKENDHFTYVYLLQGTSFFKKKYYKAIFKSKLPHFWWTEIQSVMGNLKLFFEDLGEKEKDIRIGTIAVFDFKESDKEEYGVELQKWKKQLKIAIEKQMTFTEEYNAEFGQPDLKGTGLWSDFDKNKNWE